MATDAVADDKVSTPDGDFYPVPAVPVTLLPEPSIDSRATEVRLRDELRAIEARLPLEKGEVEAYFSDMRSLTKCTLHTSMNGFGQTSFWNDSTMQSVILDGGSISSPVSETSVYVALNPPLQLNSEPLRPGSLQYVANGTTLTFYLTRGDYQLRGAFTLGTGVSSGGSNLVAVGKFTSWVHPGDSGVVPIGDTTWADALPVPPSSVPTLNGVSLEGGPGNSFHLALECLYVDSTWATQTNFGSIALTGAISLISKDFQAVYAQIEAVAENSAALAEAVAINSKAIDLNADLASAGAGLGAIEGLMSAASPSALVGQAAMGSMGMFVDEALASRIHGLTTESRRLAEYAGSGLRAVKDEAASYRTPFGGFMALLPSPAMVKGRTVGKALAYAQAVADLQGQESVCAVIGTAAYPQSDGGIHIVGAGAPPGVATPMEVDDPENPPLDLADFVAGAAPAKTASHQWIASPGVTATIDTPSWATAYEEVPSWLLSVLVTPPTPKGLFVAETRGSTVLDLGTENYTWKREMSVFPWTAEGARLSPPPEGVSPLAYLATAGMAKTDTSGNFTATVIGPAGPPAASTVDDELVPEVFPCSVSVAATEKLVNAGRDVEQLMARFKGGASVAAGSIRDAVADMRRPVTEAVSSVKAVAKSFGGADGAIAAAKSIGKMAARGTLDKIASASEAVKDVKAVASTAKRAVSLFRKIGNLFG